MPVLERIGYITVLYFSYRIVYRIFKMLFYSSVDLYSLGRWGVITGCSQGIGRAYAEVLAKLGINLVLIGSDFEKLQTISEEIEQLYNIRTKVMKLDTSGGLESYMIIEKEIIGLDVGILVNNLSICYPHPEYFLDLPHKEKIYMNIIQCNVVGITNMCRIIMPRMVVKGRGVIVNIASSVAVLPSPLLAVFAATKAYVLKFSMDLQSEYGKRGIIIQCLLPGIIAHHTLNSPQPGWMIPTAETYVESAIKMIGRETVTTGFLPHTIVIMVEKILYKLSGSLVILWMTCIMECNRANALHRYFG